MKETDLNEAPKENFLLVLRKEFQKVGGVELELPPRNDLPREIDFT